MALAHQTDKFRAMQANPGLMAEKLADLHRKPAVIVPERGLLMRPELALKTHLGVKTNTRRLCKVPAPDEATSAGVIMSEDSHNGEWSWLSGNPRDADTWEILGDDFWCPYGVPGDRLWIREEHYAYGRWTVGCGETRSGGDRWVFLRDDKYPTLFEPPEDLRPNHPRAHGIPGYYKRNSLFMLRSQCRTVVEITRVELERVQCISEDDAIAEGVDKDFDRDDHAYAPIHTHKEGYRQLWMRLHGAESWDANPFVWSLHFEKIKA